jgi:hypothetical protein
LLQGSTFCLRIERARESDTEITESHTTESTKEPGGRCGAEDSDSPSELSQEAAVEAASLHSFAVGEFGSEA